MNGHHIVVLDEIYAICSRCGQKFLLEVILNRSPPTEKDCEACMPEKREKFTKS